MMTMRGRVFISSMRRLVLTWVNQHQSATTLLGQDGSAPLVNAAFAKFSQALTPVKMGNFDSLAAVLKYLKMCVHSVIADEVRSRQSRQYEETSGFDRA